MYGTYLYMHNVLVSASHIQAEKSRYMYRFNYVVAPHDHALSDQHLNAPLGVDRR